ncbi:mucin-2 [Musca domestica]|uniref:Probable serine/threonine-protein kinase DDB_G0282963 n=1 Tax=Musca domestica TaxID=7370 RepID=A0A1I8NGY0_MUSDO|nr:mucin-2 [Musca domestica]XP_005180567.1 mucin-2 [Musca domestica]XP_019891281.1 mucin-2 [Musca domestica]
MNVPPIPPLLCSTPPPIDFGDDDDDVLPPTLDEDVDEEFGDFSGGNMKIDEPLPSPRPPSVADLPPVSIYDSFIPHDELLEGETTSKEASKKTQPTTPIVEAFNYSIIEQQTKESEEECKPVAFDHDSEKGNVETATEGQIGDHVESSTYCRTEVFAGDNSQVIDENDKTISEPLHQEINENVDTPVSKTDNTTTSSTNGHLPVTELESNMKPTISPLPNIVSIEDLEDDLSEDELYSPRTPKNLNEADITSKDFFKIQEIDVTNDKCNTNVDNSRTETDIPKRSTDSFVFADFNVPPPLNDVPPSNTNDGMDNDDDFGDFADFQDFSSNISALPPSTLNEPFVETKSTSNITESKSGQICNDLEDDFDDFIQHSHSDGDSNHSLPRQQANEGEIAFPSDDDEFDDFTCAAGVETQVSSKVPEANTNFTSEKNLKENALGSFNDLSKVSESIPNLEHKSASIESHKEFSPIHCDENDDDFGDFADFNEQPIATVPPQILQKTESQQHNIDHIVEDEDDDDDDDFGDFNTAEPITTQTEATTTTSRTTCSNAVTATLQTPKNLNERISKILEVMFSSTNIPAAETEPNENYAEAKKRKIQDIPFTSIDAAKALEYQWLNSDTRHAFIKSLGIDSRNILYGENWNPSLPRFAANLSFNPLKPMKPVSSNSGTESNTNPPCPQSLEPVPVSKNDLNKTVNNLAGNKRDIAELDWKMPSAEQNIEALNDTTADAQCANSKSSAFQVATSSPYIATEPPESLTIFDNPLDVEPDKFSKTPPISEMESVNSFCSPMPSLSTLEIDIPPVVSAPIVNTMKHLDLNEPGNSEDTLEVVTSTTFSGSFKETHIYTPPKTLDNSSSTPSSTSTTSPAKANNIDFDYEKAAMGVIIDETVVKKEYRDIEYNPPFTRESLTRTPSLKAESMEPSNNLPVQTLAVNTFSSDNTKDDFNDEFSEFQSVPSVAPVIPVATKFAATNSKSPTHQQSNRTTADISKSSNAGMILSPAILIPQAISMESNKPKIEWGDSTASINPEELARIEELFPEPTKLVKSNNTNNSSQKSTPTHQASAPTTISATVANREFEGINNGGDEDDWSDFISVPVATNNNNNNTKTPVTNNNASTKSQTNSPFKQRSPLNSYKMPNYNNTTNDDEWSDFVSSAPSPATMQPADMGANVQGPPPTHRVPQFNSGAWQNANFYNNPLSLYQKGPLNLHSSSQQSPKNFLNNNNYNQFQTANIAGHQQQIHVMQNFSTAPVPNATADRLGSSTAKTSNQFQVGSSVKVAPSIALIPDLGFVAPAIPTHTSFINSLPKPSINTKK